MNDPKVVFILSANYSGSHLLAQLLAAHSRCAGVGELHNYHKFRARGSRSGNVVDDYAEHPAFAGLDELPVRDWHRTVFARLCETGGSLSHLIDNSKRPAWAEQFPEVNAYYVHLVRDPRALVARWLRTYDSAAAARRQRRRVLRQRPWALLSTRDPLGTYLQKWLISNRRISRFLRYRQRAQLLTYRDLAVDTACALETAMARLDLAFEASQLNYGRGGGALGTRKRDYEDASAASAIQIDLRWQSELTALQRSQIEGHRGVARYLADLHLSMTPEGLTASTPRSGTDPGQR